MSVKETGFIATVDDALRQGSHLCVHITFAYENGTVRRIGTLLLPDELVSDFVTHFAHEPLSQNVTSS